MSIFGNIMSAIFKSAAPAGTAPATMPAAAPTGPGAAAPLSQVDVAAVLTKLAEQKREKLDWRKSIVDLMKLLDLDSSFAARIGAGAALYRRPERFRLHERMAA